MLIKVIGVEYAKSSRSTCSRFSRKIKLVRPANDKRPSSTKRSKEIYVLLRRPFELNVSMTGTSDVVNIGPSRRSIT